MDKKIDIISLLLTSKVAPIITNSSISGYSIILLLSAILFNNLLLNTYILNKNVLGFKTRVDHTFLG